MKLFSIFGRTDPQPDLKEGLEAILARLEKLELAFRDMQLEWTVVTSHVDQQTNKVHRELGHVTKRKHDLEKLEGDCADPDGATSIRRSRFSGGRHQ